jgi:hypothetical protein
MRCLILCLKTSQSLFFLKELTVIYELTNLQFTKMLHNLSTIVDKAVQAAETKKYEPSVLLQARLAPDQFNFTRQIQIACDTAKLCASRLTGKEAPSHPDNETTVSELKSRIDSTISYLSSFSAADYKQAETKHVSQPRWEGQYLTGEEFVLHHAIPNFYFHVTAAYSILRHNGVDVGKKDFLGKMPFRK